MLTTPDILVPSNVQNYMRFHTFVYKLMCFYIDMFYSCWLQLLFIYPTQTVYIDKHIG